MNIRPTALLSALALAMSSTLSVAAAPSHRSIKVYDATAFLPLNEAPNFGRKATAKKRNKAWAKRMHSRR